MLKSYVLHCFPRQSFLSSYAYLHSWFPATLSCIWIYWEKPLAEGHTLKLYIILCNHNLISLLIISPPTNSFAPTKLAMKNIITFLTTEKELHDLYSKIIWIQMIITIHSIEWCITSVSWSYLYKSGITSKISVTSMKVEFATKYVQEPNCT